MRYDEGMARYVAIVVWLALSSCGSAPPPNTVQLVPDSPAATAAIATMPPPAAPTSVVARNQSPAPEPVGAPSPPPDPAAIPAPPDVAAPPPNALRTPSGLATLVIRQGSGPTHPSGTSTVSAHYTGWTTDGRMFDSSVARGAPFTARLDQVIPGFSEGLQLMVEGERRRLWIPEALAYRGRPGPPAGMLVFDVELLRIMP